MKPLLVLLIVFYCNPSRSQEIVEAISKSVGLINFLDLSDSGKQYFGTGTLIRKNIDSNSFRIFLVTNRHVMPQFKQNRNAAFTIKNPDKENEVFTIPIELYNLKGQFQPNIKVGKDGNDLIVINLSDYFKQNLSQQTILNHALPFEYLADSIKLTNKKITVGDDVFFIGYPTFMYDERNFLPLVRKGIVSTPPLHDYYLSKTYQNAFRQIFKSEINNKLDGFLIDATALGGSSGSLVISQPQYMHVSTTGQVQFYNNPYHRVMVLGILTNTFFDVTEKIPGSHYANLGGVISSMQIIKTISTFN